MPSQSVNTFGCIVDDTRPIDDNFVEEPRSTVIIFIVRSSSWSLAAEAAPDIPRNAVNR